MALVPDRWAILRMRFEGPFTVLTWTDSEGGRLVIPNRWPPGVLFGYPPPSPLLDRLTTLVSALPVARPGPYNTGPVPLPLFVKVPPYLWEDVEWQVIASAFQTNLISFVGFDRVQLVTFPGLPRTRRPTFSLPFDVLAHGASARSDLEAFSKHSWLQTDDAQEWGMRLDFTSDNDKTSLEMALRDSGRDILITTEAADAIAICRTLPVPSRPRLIVLKADRLAVASSVSLAPPRGVATVWVGPQAGERQIGELLFGLVHDLPIHECVRAAERRFADPARPIRIFADPSTNQSLRIRDALVNLYTQAERLDIQLPKQDLESLLNELELKADADDRARLIAVRDRYSSSWSGAVPPQDDPGAMAQNALKELVQMRDTAAEARSEPYQFEQFEQEGRGLVPMARRSVRVADVAARLSRVAAPLETMRADPDLRALAENQPRVVDIAMQRLETSPLLESVDSHVALAPGTKYRLRVHIGTPLPDTLITGTRPSVDVILPDTTDERGHMLDVVVQGKDFTVTSQRSMPLQLPRFGNSEPVYFTVRTPRQTGPAALRVHFYYQNHLVQSYLLQSAIEPQETPLNDDVLRVTLAYTRVKKLEDSTHLKSRAFSVAANAGAGTHELILKGSANAAAEVELGNTTYDVEVRRFRRLLDTAARDPVNPANGRVYPLVATGAAPSKFVADTIRSFARQGSNLYEAVFRGASRSTPAIRRQLIDLKAKRDQKIQIVRIDDTFVFPWTIVYDYTLPDTLAGAPDPAVCLGTVIGPAGTAVPCAHGADSGVVCVNGFWSIRHDLEELIGRGSDTDPSVTCPAADGVRVVCDATLPDAGKFETAMKSLVPAPNLAVGPAQEAALLDLLWQTPPVRPSILVVIGHMETAVKAGEPDPPRVVLVPSTHWLTRKRLADRALATDAWTQPRSIVMLLACEAMTTTAATVNDFVTSLALAGAAAVVGAEAVVPSDLAMTCAQRLTDALWSHRTLGMAMTDLRRELIYAGNPLAFIFTAVGSVDLMLN